MELISTSQGFWEFLSQPWHWAVSGAAISLLVFIMTWLGKSFGVSTTFEVACSVMGAGKHIPFFQKRSLSADGWRIAFVVGAIAGGFLTSQFLSSPEPVNISAATIAHLQDWGLSYPAADSTGGGFFPTDLLNFNSFKGIALALVGGFLIGFGARYAGGCTSGHAITGLSHLQWQSFVTVIGFFIGGLVMTHLIMPILFG